MIGPDPNSIYPNENIRQIVYIKNVITRPNIIAGDYSYYDDVNGAERFEEHVTHHYEFLGDRLIIGKFCAIARGIEFVMNGANHRMNSATTYPFNIMGGGWERYSPALADLPAYCVAGGNPCRVIRRRFDDDLTEHLLKLRWWDWDAEKIFQNMGALCSGDLEEIRRIEA